jgi:hypothetical protein
MTARAFRLSDIGVSTKISAALGILVLTMCATGLFSTDRLMRVNQTTVDINSSWLPSIRYIGEVRYDMARHRAIISRHASQTEDPTAGPTRVRENNEKNQIFDRPSDLCHHRFELLRSDRSCGHPGR